MDINDSQRCLSFKAAITRHSVCINAQNYDKSCQSSDLFQCNTHVYKWKKQQPPLLKAKLSAWPHLACARAPAVRHTTTMDHGMTALANCPKNWNHQHKPGCRHPLLAEETPQTFSAPDRNQIANISVLRRRIGLLRVMKRPLFQPQYDRVIRAKDKIIDAQVSCARQRLNTRHNGYGWYWSATFIGNAF